MTESIREEQDKRATATAIDPEQEDRGPRQ